jgi:WhiB family redox-sensing transcriptional regulator
MSREEPVSMRRSAWGFDSGESEMWRDDAICSSTDPEAFYPDKGNSSRDAKTICALCPVQPDCLDYALRRDERFGVWGGLSERERRSLKRQRRGAA